MVCNGGSGEALYLKKPCHEEFVSRDSPLVPPGTVLRLIVHGLVPRGHHASSKFFEWRLYVQNLSSVLQLQSAGSCLLLLDEGFTSLVVLK